MLANSLKCFVFLILSPLGLSSSQERTSSTGHVLPFLSAFATQPYVFFSTWQNSHLWRPKAGAFCLVSFPWLLDGLACPTPIPIQEYLSPLLRQDNEQLIYCSLCCFWMLRFRIAVVHGYLVLLVLGLHFVHRKVNEESLNINNK